MSDQAHKIPIIMEQDGYRATVTYDPVIGMFAGVVVGTRDVVTFYGATQADAKREFAASLVDYRALCREREIEPEKPSNGPSGASIVT